MEENKKDKPASVPYEIPVAGSLGLLALGAVGFKLWRQKKAEVEAREKEEKQKTENKEGENG